MKIIDVLKHCVQLLGLNEALAELNNATEENEAEILQNEEINRLINLCALSIQELCSNYVSVYVEEEIETEDKQIPISKLNNFIRIVNITNQGTKVKYKVLNRNLVLEEDGIYVVKYCTYPEIKSLFDEIDFLSNFNPDVITMAVCAYFAISHGMFEEFNLYHEKYIEKALTLKELRIFELPLRRWE